MNKVIVAKPGFNAKTETNPDNLKFSSDYNTLKYYFSDTFLMTGVTGTTNVSIAHNLGYVPFHIVFCNDFFAQPTKFGLTEYFNSFGGRLRAARAYCDENNLYLSLNLAAGTPIDVIWHYKLFRNNLNL